MLLRYLGGQIAIGLLFSIGSGLYSLASRLASRAFPEKSTDPITGDDLSRSERASWLAQAVIRRWTFLALFTGLSIVWWTNPLWFRDPGLVHWNVFASYLAIVIESVVGIAMFGQVRRDAVILREVKRSGSREHSELGTAISEIEEDIAAVFDSLEEIKLATRSSKVAQQAESVRLQADKAIAALEQLSASLQGE